MSALACLRVRGKSLSPHIRVIHRATHPKRLRINCPASLIFSYRFIDRRWRVTRHYISARDALRFVAPIVMPTRLANLTCSSSPKGHRRPPRVEQRRPDGARASDSRVPEGSTHPKRSPAAPHGPRVGHAWTWRCRQPRPMSKPVAYATRLGPRLHSSNEPHRKRARRRQRRVGKPADERRA